jgi:hypothetical protein
LPPLAFAKRNNERSAREGKRGQATLPDLFYFKFHLLAVGDVGAVKKSISSMIGNFGF